MWFPSAGWTTTLCLIYLSSGECYTYIMCRVCLWVSVFLQVCGVLWFLNMFVCGMFWCFMHLYWCLYAWAVHTWLEACWCYVAGLAVGDVVSECRLNHYWPVHCGPWGFRGLWPLGTRGLYPPCSAPNSRKLLKMDVLTSETCWAVNWRNKASVIKVGLPLFKYQDDARSNTHKITE